MRLPIATFSINASVVLPMILFGIAQLRGMVSRAASAARSRTACVGRRRKQYE